MSQRFVGLLFGALFGFVIAWADITNPAVIHDMLQLREFDVFLIMGSAVVVAAVGARALRAARIRSWLTQEPINWSLARPERRHVIGSVVFGAGWSIACTCPGPLAAMIGEGRLGALWVTAGLIAGIVAEGALAPKRHAPATCSETSVAGL